MPAGPYTDQTLWTANQDQILLRTLDDVTVAYHKVSGDTHILNFLSLAILETLSVQDETFASAAPQIWKAIQVGEQDCSIELIKGTFLQLDDVGLISPKCAVS